MRSFKTFLTESSVASFDVKSIEIEDLIDCYKNAGYTVSRSKMKAFKDCRYEGYKAKSHSYIVFMADDNNKRFYLTRFYLSLGQEGFVIAEPAGAPFFENENEAKVRAKFETF